MQKFNYTCMQYLIYSQSTEAIYSVFARCEYIDSSLILHVPNNDSIISFDNEVQINVYICFFDCQISSR